MSKLQEANSKVYYNEHDIFSTYANEHGLSKNEFLLILRTFNFLLLKSIIEDGKVYSLPPRMGTLSVRKMPFRGKKLVDFAHFNKTGEKKYIKNFHSAGYIAKFHWDRTYPWMKVIDPRAANVFRLKISRDFSRYISKQIKENNSINKYYDY